MKQNRMLLCWSLVAGLLLFAGCDDAAKKDAENKDGGTQAANGTDPGKTDDGQDDGQDVSDLVGKIQVDGSSTVFPMTTLAADGFRTTYPKVEVNVGASGTGGGFKRFSTGETQISDASRPIKKEEFEACMSNGVEFIELPIAYDGLTFVVHKDNDWAKELTVDQLKQIFLADGKDKVMWNEIDASWPAQPVVIFAPGTDSGTFDYAKEVLAKDSEMRPGMTTSEDDNFIVNGVAGDKNAIGFFGASYYFLNKDKLNSVAIVNPDTGTAVSPAADTIESGEYAPFSRPLFIYVNLSAANRPEVQAFVSYYLEQAARVAEEKAYVALPAAIYAKSFTNFAKKTTGTHFLTDEGGHRKGPLEEVFVETNLAKTVK